MRSYRNLEPNLVRGTPCPTSADVLAKRRGGVGRPCTQDADERGGAMGAFLSLRAVEPQRLMAPGRATMRKLAIIRQGQSPELSWCAAKESNLQPTEESDQGGCGESGRIGVKRNEDTFFAPFSFPAKLRLVPAHPDSLGYSRATAREDWAPISNC